MTRKPRNGDPVATTSADLLAQRIDLLQELFPEAFSEGNVDLGKLGAALGILADDKSERYTFSWAGKRDAQRILQIPTRATLVPCPEESVSWENTGNLFIEGDNLEVLKLLLRPYYGQVKLIYIDPPYNTGNDFVYPDDYADPLVPYLCLTGQSDEAGNLLTSNPETSGRFHSAWLSMMYPRLFLARQLLSEEGTVWISIDDIEVANLRSICNEVFGQENFVATFIWEKRTTRENRRVFSFSHDYVLCYARSKDVFQAARNLLPLTDEVLARYGNPDNDPRGDWQSVSLNAQAGHGTTAQFYDVLTPAGRKIPPPPGRCWSVTKDRLDDLIADNRVWFGPEGKGVPRLKVFLSEAKPGLTPETLWTADEVGTTDSAKKALIDLFSGKAVYDTPKPVELIKRILQIATGPKDLTIDFFAGSCTAAQAVLELNRQSESDRRFIVVQLPEPTPEDSEARQAGYMTIAEIGKDRIRRVIAQMRQADAGKLPLSTHEGPEDLGFRVFKLAPSSYRVWSDVENDTPQSYGQQLDLFTDPLVDGWTPEAVIAEVALKEAGFGLGYRVERVGPVKKQTIYRVSDAEKDQFFYICLDDRIDLKNLRSLPSGESDLFICRDAALDDTAAANLALQYRLKTI